MPEKNGKAEKAVRYFIAEAYIDSNCSIPDTIHDGQASYKVRVSGDTRRGSGCAPLYSPDQ